MLESLKSVREKSSNSVDLSRNLCIKSLKRFDVKSGVNEVRNASTFYIVQRKDKQKKALIKVPLSLSRAQSWMSWKAFHRAGLNFHE